MIKFAIALVFMFSNYAMAEQLHMPKLEFQTTMGNFVVELNHRKAPITVDNFLAYVDSGHFEGMVFHRVIKDFVIQGGGHKRGDKILEEQITNAPIPLESNVGLSNLRGTIGMARTEVPDSATSQFFFNVKDNTRLDYQSEEKPGYAVFGKILTGIEVMDTIRAVFTGEQEFLVYEEGKQIKITMPDVPNKDVVITKIRRL